MSDNNNKEEVPQTPAQEPNNNQEKDARIKVHLEVYDAERADHHIEATKLHDDPKKAVIYDKRAVRWNFENLSLPVRDTARVVGWVAAEDRPTITDSELDELAEEFGCKMCKEGFAPTDRLAMHRGIARALEQLKNITLEEKMDMINLRRAIEKFDACIRLIVGFDCERLDIERAYRKIDEDMDAVLPGRVEMACMAALRAKRLRAKETPEPEPFTKLADGVEFRRLHPTTEQMNALRKILSRVTGEKIGGKGAILEVGTPKKPCKCGGKNHKDDKKCNCAEGQCRCGTKKHCGGKKKTLVISDTWETNLYQLQFCKKLLVRAQNGLADTLKNLIDGFIDDSKNNYPVPVFKNKPAVLAKLNRFAVKATDIAKLRITFDPDAKSATGATLPAFHVGLSK